LNHFNDQDKVMDGCREKNQRNILQSKSSEEKRKNIVEDGEELIDRWSSSKNIKGHVPKSSVIIRDISVHCTEKDLYSLFQAFEASIFRITVRRNDEGRSLLHAFADCKDREGAAGLIRSFNNYKFMGRVMKLEFCDPHQKNSSAEQVQPKKFQIHALYESIQTEEAEEQNFHGQSRVTEEMFERECSKFGRLVDVVIKKHDEISDRSGKFIVSQKGYGFLYFADIQSAQKAVLSSPVFVNYDKVVCILDYSHITEEEFHSDGVMKKSSLPQKNQRKMNSQRSSRPEPISTAPTFTHPQSDNTQIGFYPPPPVNVGFQPQTTMLPQQPVMVYTPPLSMPLSSPMYASMHSSYYSSSSYSSPAPSYSNHMSPPIYYAATPMNTMAALPQQQIFTPLPSSPMYPFSSNSNFPVYPSPNPFDVSYGTNTMTGVVPHPNNLPPQTNFDNTSEGLNRRKSSQKHINQMRSL